VLKILGGFVVAVLCYFGHDCRVMHGMCVVFGCVVGWNLLNVCAVFL
jgi:hypothetical protein